MSDPSKTSPPFGEEKGRMKFALVAKDCVACGACTKVCRLRAISVDRGIRALVNKEKCVGCGLCAKACPAGVITIEGGSAQ